jgi:hypothetical protein
MKKTIMLLAAAATITTAANADMLAGWDFSQYMGSGFNSLDGATFTETLASNYSDLDTTGVGIGVGLESGTFGMMYLDGSYGSTDMNPDGTSDEIMPASGSLTSNLSPGIAQFGTSESIKSLQEGAQNYNNNLSFTSQKSGFDLVFGLDVSSVGFAEDISFSFAALDTDSASVSLSFSTDGSNWSTAENFSVTTTDSLFTSSTYDVTSDTAYFMLSFAEAGTQIDNVSISGSVVPEPSSFAAIAGVFALGFVACRRRKN